MIAVINNWPWILNSPISISVTLWTVSWELRTQFKYPWRKCTSVRNSIYCNIFICSKVVYSNKNYTSLIMKFQRASLPVLFYKAVISSWAVLQVSRGREVLLKIMKLKLYTTWRNSQSIFSVMLELDLSIRRSRWFTGHSLFFPRTALWWWHRHIFL